MKKGLIALFAALSLVGITNVEAMSKDELKTKLTASYTINGAVFKLDSAQVVQLERYLDSYELSSDDADYISKKVDEAIAVIDASDVKSIDALSKQDRSKLSKLVSDVSNNTSVKASVSGGELVIYDPVTGKEFTRITKKAKQTGTTDYILIVSGLVSLVGISTLVIKKGKNENV